MLQAQSGLNLACDWVLVMAEWLAGTIADFDEIEVSSSFVGRLEETVPGEGLYSTILGLATRVSGLVAVNIIIIMTVGIALAFSILESNAKVGHYVPRHWMVQTSITHIQGFLY